MNALDLQNFLTSYSRVAAQPSQDMTNWNLIDKFLNEIKPLAIRVVLANLLGAHHTNFPGVGLAQPLMTQSESLDQGCYSFTSFEQVPTIPSPAPADMPLDLSMHSSSQQTSETITIPSSQGDLSQSFHLFQPSNMDDAMSQFCASIYPNSFASQAFSSSMPSLTATSGRKSSTQRRRRLHETSTSHSRGCRSSLSNGSLLEKLPQVCNQCGKSFTSSRLLDDHTKLEHRNYQCTYGNCKALFTQRSNLNRHCLGHLNRKPITCLLCQKRFTRKDHCVKHVQETHGAQENYRDCISVDIATSKCLEALGLIDRQAAVYHSMADPVSTDDSDSSLHHNISLTIDCPIEETPLFQTANQTEEDLNESINVVS